MAGGKGQDPVIAAGCLVTRGHGAATEVLLIHRPKYDDWSLPKGKQEPGEHVLATAVREVHEESGLRVALRRPLPSRDYLADGQPKVVHYWRATVVDDDGFVETKEVDAVAWLPIAEAARTATHAPDGALIAQALEPAATPFLVLRHAKARKRAAWDGPDRERPLDRNGVAQARRLVPMLAAYGVRAVHSSTAERCTATVLPYAERSGFAIIREPELTEEAFEADPAAGLARSSALLADAGKTDTPAVLCGHRPVMPALLAELLQGSGLVGPTDTMPTGSFVVVHINGADVVATEHHLLP